MAEYGRVFYTLQHEMTPDIRRELRASYWEANSAVGGDLSDMEVLDLGPIPGVGLWHAWGWRADGPDPEE